MDRFTDFGIETVTDPDGKEIPKQDLYFVELEDGYRYAVRGSGTEPKIKFYLFGNDAIEDASRLEKTKTKTRDRLEALKAAILDDAKVQRRRIVAFRLREYFIRLFELPLIGRTSSRTAA